MLQLVNGFWVEQVVLAIPTPLVFSSTIEFPILGAPLGKRQAMAPFNFCSYGIDPNAPDPGCSPGKIAVNKASIQSNCFKDLGATIAL